MLISSFSKLTGASPHALRHYEKLGLITPTRDASGYRHYPDALKREVVFITMSRRIGISLADIAQWLPLYRQRRLSAAQMVDLLQERVTALDQQIKSLALQRQTVVDHIAWVKAQEKKSRRVKPTASTKPWPSSAYRSNPSKGKP